MCPDKILSALLKKTLCGAVIVELPLEARPTNEMVVDCNPTGCGLCAFIHFNMKCLLLTLSRRYISTYDVRVKKGFLAVVLVVKHA